MIKGQTTCNSWKLFITDILAKPIFIIVGNGKSLQIVARLLLTFTIHYTNEGQLHRNICFKGSQGVANRPSLNHSLNK